MAERILKEILQSSEKGAINIMITLFTQEEVLEAAFAEKEREANEKCMQEGMQKGMQEGMQKATIAAIHSVMNNLDLTVEKALSVVGVPQNKWNNYIPLLR